MMTLANRLASLIILLLLSCSSPEKNLVTINGNTMGTTYTVKFFPKTNNPEEIEELEKKIKKLTSTKKIKFTWGSGFIFYGSRSYLKKKGQSPDT